jgi:hypothetical protein
LALYRKATQGELPREDGFVNRLKQAGTQLAVNLNGGVEDEVPISFSVMG